MQILRMISDLDDKTVTKFLKKSLSYKSKRFLTEVRSNFKQIGMELTTKLVIEMFNEYLRDVDSEDSQLLKLVSDASSSDDNEVKAKDAKLSLFVADMVNGLHNLYSKHNQFKLTKNEKKVDFLKHHNTIESALISLGFSFQDSEKLKRIDQQLKGLISQNAERLNTLQPKDGVYIESFKDMLTLLSERKFIPEGFNKDDVKLKWINKSIDFNFSYDHNQEDSTLKINWTSFVHLADWLLFLKEYYINYTFQDNTELLEWVINNISYKDESFIRSGKNYSNLKRKLRERKIYVSDCMKIEDGKFYIIKNYG